MVMAEFYIKFEDNPDYANIKTYATNFNAANVCGTDNNTPVDDEKWATQKTAYQALDPTDQALLTGCDFKGGAIGECLERYDRVVKLHGVDYDFMGRVAAGKITLTVSSPAVTVSTDFPLTAIVIIGLVSLTAIGGFFFYRKRKEN